MRIMVTGGTGFVGAHAVRALVEAGHEVALLVRAPERVADALRPLGVDPGRYEVVPGDVLDDRSVRRALNGADALLHAANVYSFNVTDASVMHQVNVDGTRRILHAAAERNLDPIVHVSSVVALLPSDHLSNDSPVGSPQGPYPTSKAAAEVIAREFQAEGAPVVITHPGEVLGPHDPHEGGNSSVAILRDMVRGRARSVMPGRIGVVDVRDLGDAHARLFTAGHGPRRYLMAGHETTLEQQFQLLTACLGRRLPRIPVPVGAAMATGRVAESFQRRGVDPGFSSTNPWLLANHPGFDDTPTQRDLGVSWRPVTDTLRDTVAWLHARGLVSRRQAGLAAAPRTTEPVHATDEVRSR